jgi:hypothetical protein
MRQRFSRWLSLITVCFMLSVYCTTAQAALKAVGPLDLGNGFPTWYQDANNVALVPCLSLTLLPSGNQGCVLPAQPPFYDGTANILFPGNYPFEVFYFIADSNATTMTPAPALGTPVDSFVYRAALEATFGTAAPAAGGQVTFARIRMRMDAPVAGTYTITHPFGVETINVTTPGIKAINVTRDIGITPFPTGPLTGDIGPWLTRVGYPVTVAATGETFIGDFNVPGPVTGSPTGNNFIRIVGPVGANLGFGSNTFTTANFAVAGKVFTGQVPSPLTIDRTTYARDAVASQVDVFVTAPGVGAIPAISGTGILTTNLTQDFAATGKFFTHLTAPTLPSALNITNSLDIPPILHPVTLVDEVNITLATYNPVTHNLTIKAASRDKVGAPTLNAVGITAPGSLDPIIAGTLVKTITTNPIIPPLNVTVVSSNGGSATAPVSVVTPPAPPVAVADSATTVGTTPVLIDVLFNDTPAVNIDPTTVAIVTPGNGTTSINPVNGTVTFTPNAAAVTAGTASFTYKVMDIFGQFSLPATVTVTVTAPAPPPPATPTPPVAIADTAKTTPGTAVTIPVLANDTIAAPGVINRATVQIVPATAPNPATVGTAVANLDGTVTFTPAAAFLGPVTFTYTVSDSTAPTANVSNQALVTVNVAANIPPVANADVSSTFVGVPRIINVKANDTDADGTIAAGAVTLVTLPTSGTVAANLDGTVTYTPNLAGTYTFTYHVSDNLGAISNDATVTVSVTSPITDSITVLKAEYNTATGQWLAEGTTTGVSPLSKTVTIYLGKNLTGQIIGTTATTAADGRWKFGFSFGAGALAPALLDRTISVALPSGASRLAFPAVVK